MCIPSSHSHNFFPSIWSQNSQFYSQNIYRLHFKIFFSAKTHHPGKHDILGRECLPLYKRICTTILGGFLFTRCCSCSVSANIRQSFLRLKFHGNATYLIPNRILYEMSQIDKIVYNMFTSEKNLKGFNKIETNNALRPVLRISIVGNLVSQVSRYLEQYRVSNLQFRVSTMWLRLISEMKKTK